VGAWLNFYVMAQTMPEAAKLLDIYHRRLRSNLRHALRPLVGDRAPDVAEAMAALIDGVYLRQVLTSGRTDKTAAVDLVIGVLDSQLAQGGAE
jgi:TetR/AcrR family transcriptional repressor of bet genes